MGRPSDHLPAPPDLPSFRIESNPDESNAVSPSERHAGTGLVRHAVTLDEHRLDVDAARVVRRLERGGFQAYLVGGCVRDLLLGGTPKDYDIATSARPEDVRSLFRNCRVIDDASGLRTSSSEPRSSRSPPSGGAPRPSSRRRTATSSTIS